MKKTANIIIGIDATRNRSGGAIAHLRGILDYSPQKYGIKKVHLWAYPDLLKKVKNHTWLVKHAIDLRQSNIIFEILWQFMCLPFLAKKEKVNVMFNTDAGSFCLFQPSVTLSQDLLSFEKGEMNRYIFFPLKYLRLLVLRYVQIHRLKKSNIAIFLTNYAKNSITKFTKIKSLQIISHGINDDFKQINQNKKNLSFKRIKCIYVSNVAPYKHQWKVIEAIYNLRKKLNINIEIKFVGGVDKVCKRKFTDSIKKFDPQNKFVINYPFLKNNLLPKILSNSDIFIFASSCENMPITLLEAMSVGIPIICSNRGPMPEILKDGGIYFDPEEPNSIMIALEEIITNNELRLNLAKKSKEYSSLFSWEKCSNLTWKTLVSAVCK